MGNGGEAAYATTMLDRERLEKFAVKVAAEAKIPPDVNPVYQTSTRQMTETRHRIGLFGWRREARPRAAESREIVMGAGWLLFQTKHWIDEYNTGRYKACEYEETNQWVLDEKGGLWKVWDWTMYEEFKSGGNNRSGERTARPMTDDDIVALDHEYRHRTYPSPSRNNIRGNRDRGRIIRHAKGIGLSLALRNLREGAKQAANRPGDRAQ